MLQLYLIKQTSLAFRILPRAASQCFVYNASYWLLSIRSYQALVARRNTLSEHISNYATRAHSSTNFDKRKHQKLFHFKLNSQKSTIRFTSSATLPTYEVRVATAGQESCLHCTISKEEYQGLVDIYEDDSNALGESQIGCSDSSHLQHEIAKGVIKRKEDINFESESINNATNPITMSINQLKKSLKNSDLSSEHIFNLYRNIPQPGVVHLSSPYIRKLLRHLSVLETLDEAAMLRYLSVLDDMNAVGKPMTRSEWTSAIALVGRCFGQISTSEVESALQIWRKMEKEAHVKPSEVTFNVLFDVAAKAGKFALAELIFLEMKNRNLRLNRYFRTGQIFYHGLKGDGTGVKRAYKELIRAGEIVDTVVLNCVITSLFRVGESSAAEVVFERMKSLHHTKVNSRLPPKSWRHTKELSVLLNKMAHQFRDDSDARQRLQDFTPVAPNLQTFKILIRYHAFDSGNLDRIIGLIGEMLHYKLLTDRSLFFILFKGFKIHGGQRYSAWTRLRLEGLWKSYSESWLLAAEPYAMHTSLAIIILLAYKNCIGEIRMREIWNDICGRWAPSREDLGTVVDTVGVY